MTLSDLVAGCDGLLTKESNDTPISGISYDSRKVKKGDLFVCISGFVTDGHDYARQAEAKGAAAVICERDTGVAVPQIRVKNARRTLAQVSHRFYQNPSERFKLIGVTGTNGKTTVTYLVKAILEEAGHRVGLIGTNQNMIGARVLESERTTPESLELCQLFGQMAAAGADYVVMEVSSHSLALHRVDCCEFDVGVFTNLTQDHLDFHGDMQSYLDAKARLFSMCTTGVINIDDEGGREILKKCPCLTVTYGIDSAADIFAQGMRFAGESVEFDCDILGRMSYIHLNTPGKFSVYNALAAIGACTVCGIPADTIKRGLGGVSGVCGRAEIVPLGKDYTVMIDYAHTPDGLENIIRSLRSFARGRVVTLFGCGGDRDKSKREKMGQIAGELSDFCILTSDNPRSEPPMEIIRTIERGTIASGCEYITIENRREAIRYALSHAREGDVILLAGKGHETYQVLKDGRIDFDERKVVREVLKEIEGK